MVEPSAEDVGGILPAPGNIEDERKPPPCVQIKESWRGSQGLGHPIGGCRAAILV